MPVMHLRQTRFTYSAYGLFTKYKKRIKKFKEAGDYLYQSELDKTCFQDDMTYGYFKDLNIRNFLITYYGIKHLILLKIKTMIDIYVELPQRFINFLIKKRLVAVLKMKILLIKNWQKNYTNQLLQNLIKEKYIHLLQTLFAV